MMSIVDGEEVWCQQDYGDQIVGVFLLYQGMHVCCMCTGLGLVPYTCLAYFSIFAWEGCLGYVNIPRV